MCGPLMAFRCLNSSLHHNNSIHLHSFIGHLSNFSSQKTLTMDLLHSAARFVSTHHPLPRRSFTVRSCLPFPKHQAKYHRELEAAIDAVERSCRLCVDVQRTLFSTEGNVLQKNDQSPVTVADFGVQALISLELGKLFPSIPLVAEEDSASIRANNLVDPVVSAVTAYSSFDEEELTHSDVLEAVDRGGKDAFTFCTKPATYWVLDPIDGTRGFLLGDDARYVVGLCLVVEGEIILGIMGCPNWHENSTSERGIIMVAHAGCGTWTKSLNDFAAKKPDGWTRRYVDSCSIVPKARFLISDGQTWDSLPVSSLYNATTDPNEIKDNEVLLLPRCCGSLYKYLMVAYGSGSVFILRARKILKTWDHAVGIVCVQEAGGKATDWEGNEVDLEVDQAERRNIFPAGGVLVTNANLYTNILDMVSSNSSISSGV